MTEEKRKRVLGDHKRVKTKLVTPFNAAVGPLRETSWINVMIPELLWIALVQNNLGPHRGVEIITAFTRDVRASDPNRDNTIWAAAGKFSVLPEGFLMSVVEDKPYRDELCSSLAPLYEHYPAHPMHELVPPRTVPPASNDLKILKQLLTELFDRATKNAILVQATAIWLAFDAGRLKVAPQLVLADFPQIEEYPTTEKSRRIAASIRATLNMMFGEIGQMASGTEWPTTFWNRGLELEPCED